MLPPEILSYLRSSNRTTSGAVKVTRTVSPISAPLFAYQRPKAFKSPSPWNCFAKISPAVELPAARAAKDGNPSVRTPLMLRVIRLFVLNLMRLILLRINYPGVMC